MDNIVSTFNKGENQVIQVKSLQKPSKKSGKRLNPGAVSTNKTLGIKIINVGTKVLYVDSVKMRRKVQ